MQVLTWSETTVKGGEKLSLILKEPEKRAGYYNDIAVLAVKIPAGGDKARLDNIRPKAFFERGGDWLGLQVKGTVSEGGSSEGAIPQNDVTVLKCAADGKLTWNAPAGDWLLFRMGHTPTGAINAPAPKSGEGLECDKLSRESIERAVQRNPLLLQEFGRSLDERRADVLRALAGDAEQTQTVEP